MFGSLFVEKNPTVAHFCCVVRSRAVELANGPRAVVKKHIVVLCNGCSSVSLEMMQEP